MDMKRSRRNFLGVGISLATAFAASTWGARALAGQGQIPMPMPGQGPRPQSPFPGGPLDPIPMPEHKESAAERLKRNQAKIKQDMQRLKEAVGELQKEFDSNNTTSVLSV